VGNGGQRCEIGAVRPLDPGKRAARKRFFFEKKNQKTFAI
jgi:hypothetical protein